MRIINLYHGNDTLYDDSHILSPTGWIARSPRDTTIYEVDELYSFPRNSFATPVVTEGKTDNFFYAKIKVTPDATGALPEKILTPHFCKKVGCHMPQKKFSLCARETQKSQKIKLFEDFISKNVIRLSLLLYVYKYFVKFFGEGFERGVSFRRIEVSRWRPESLFLVSLIFLGGTKE